GGLGGRGSRTGRAAHHVRRGLIELTMRFDVHLRAGVAQRLDALARQMRDWESSDRIDDAERARIRGAVRSFGHSTSERTLLVARVDGTGDFPSVAYADSFVYATVAQATCYEACRTTGLREVVALPPLIEFTWVPEDAERRVLSLDATFAALAGLPIEE